MTARRNAAPPSDVPDGPVAGLAARRTAHEAVAGLLGKGRAFALEDALAQAGAGLEPGEAALARAIATATFRRFGLLRGVLAERMSQGLPEDDPRLLALLATGAAQILDLAVADHAAVDLSVRLAKADPELRYRAGLVNAVLRRVTREREAILANAGDPLDVNTPDWLAVRWRAAYGEDAARRIAAAHLDGAAVDLTIREDAETWATTLGGVALGLGSVRLAEVDTPVASLPGYGEGAWWVQDAAAALPARLLQAKPGERIADLCAAPGGKTAQLAAAGAAVLAVDRSGVRLERLRKNLDRLGLTAEIRVGDAITLDLGEPFDGVLLDAPCSATGTIRRHPDVAWTKTETDVARLAGLQRRLLEKAATLVRPGGRLVYCSCSLEPEEGERQIAGFLQHHPEFERVPVTPDEVAGQIEMIDPQGDLRTLPCHLPLSSGGEAGLRRSGLDGFFASRLRRKS
ncbi:RsmB/NOP family class I SAM-dependent RNA methyltransferase [Methylobacterium sp. WL9]|uniref:RsmB/NOP family class I SAM-dependent RNA methyltransferase n=1 Tax=Methylobacterium sp. WL9 TaxID=2603898 RepID=UPI0011CAFC0D|nr:RsmB/NOP family class I SAM-dependent RNA methyltransferase [Methylobacterium sp. WL9]TXN24310.1 RsmB/NOP family class I SAM-dependent RNA methyltransferase [Methylobacterium sp. WL9]